MCRCKNKQSKKIENCQAPAEKHQSTPLALNSTNLRRLAMEKQKSELKNALNSGRKIRGEDDTLRDIPTEMPNYDVEQDEQFNDSLPEPVADDVKQGFPKKSNSNSNRVSSEEQSAKDAPEERSESADNNAGKVPDDSVDPSKSQTGEVKNDMEQ